jgi:hypothetical protein
MLQSCTDLALEKANRNNNQSAPIIGAVIVIYNRRCDESVSFIKMTQSKPSVLLLIDNSTDEETVSYNSRYCLENKCEYTSMDGNAGLSRAYNEAIRVLNGRIDYLIILDDDTIVPDHLMVRLEEEIRRFPDTDIFVPLVTDQKSLLSPCRRRGSLFFRLRERPDTFTSRMSAINSGLVIRLYNRTGDTGDTGDIGISARTEDTPHFDEGLFLDCVDHLFIYKQIRQGAVFHMYPVEFRQNFFDREQDGQKERKVKSILRFKQYIIDYRYFYKVCRFNRPISELYILHRAIRLNLRFRTTEFFAPLRLHVTNARPTKEKSKEK